MMRSLTMVVVLLVACRESKHPKPVIKADPELLRTIAVMVTTKAPDGAALQQAADQIARGELTLQGYVDRVLNSEEFANDVAPLIVLRHLLSQDSFGAPKGVTLSKTDGPRPVFYLGEACAPEQAVPVVPWWNLIEGRDETVLVCPDAYRPDMWFAEVPSGDDPIACLSLYGPQRTSGRRCGCGPNLLRCYEASDKRMAMKRSLQEELRGSVAYNVSRGRAITEIFTSNETFRDRNAEFLMQTFAAEAAQRPIPEDVLRGLASWPKAGKWAPRQDLAKGQNAGILTSPQVVHFTLDRRQRMTAIYDLLWCMEPDSLGAAPETLLTIQGANFQIGSDGWEDLAKRPICTSCHARLDYGFQFFWGFANGNLQAYYVPSLQKSGKGPLFVDDIDDRRGEAELTPQGFASLAIAQPEFKHCVARNFTEYVLGNKVTAEQISKVQSAIVDTTSARGVMRAALQLLIDDWGKHTRRPEPPAVAKASPARGPVVVEGERNAQLEALCVDCHDHEPDRVNLMATELDRKTVVAMLESVSSRRMPKNNPLSQADRNKFLRVYIDALWAGQDAEEARQYFIERTNALPVFRPEVAFALIHSKARDTTPSSWRMVENAARPNYQQLTPGFAAITGLEAIAACRTGNRTREERQRCLSEAIKLEHMTGRGKN